MIVMAIILFVAGLITGIILLVRHQEKVRREALQEFADSLGLEFHAKGHSKIQSRIAGFKLFNQGDSRKMKNVICGETEVVNVAIFDYQYSTGAGNSRSTHSQTVVAMEARELEIPAFTMRPEHFFDRLGSMLGFQDIDFEDHPEFSKMFVLKGENETQIRDFFDRPLLDFFATRKGISFEGTASPGEKAEEFSPAIGQQERTGRFIYFKGGKPVKPEELRDLLNQGYSVYAAFMERLQRGRAN